MQFNKLLAAIGCAATALALTLTGCSSKGGSTSSYYPTTDDSKGTPVAEDPFKKCEDHDNYVVTIKDHGKKLKRCFQPSYNLNLPRVTDSSIVLSYPECDTDEYVAEVPISPVPAWKEKKYFCFDHVPGSDKGKKPKHRRSSSPVPSKSPSTPKKLDPSKDDTSEKDASKKDTAKSRNK